MNTEPTVFVVDDNQMAGALRGLIEAEGLAVETYTCGAEFLKAYRPERPGCLVLDTQVHKMGGLELYEQLRVRQCTLPVIIISAQADIPLAVRLMKAGVFDVLQEPVGAQHLLDRICAAVDLDAQQRVGHERSQAFEQRIARLTPREREVLDLAVAGRANKQISGQLYVSEKTVEVRRKRVMRKMEASCVVDLVRTVLSFRGVTAGQSPGTGLGGDWYVA